MAMIPKLIAALACMFMFSWSVAAFDIRYNALGKCDSDTVATVSWAVAPCTNISLPGSTLQSNCQTMIGCIAGKTAASDYVKCQYATGSDVLYTYRIDTVDSTSGLRLTVYADNATCETKTGASLTYDVFPSTCYPVTVGGNACYYSSVPPTSAAATLTGFAELIF